MDDTWAGGRNNTTAELFADPGKFPSQIPALADYV